MERDVTETRSHTSELLDHLGNYSDVYSGPMV